MRTLAVWIGLLAPLAAQDAPKPARPGLVVRDGVAGSEEGHALHEIHYWMRWGDFDLAEAAYRIGCREVRTPSVRFVRSWALLRWAVDRKKGFERALAAFDEIDAPDEAFRDHVAALARSLRAVLPCGRCEGRGRIRCVVCHGVGLVRSADDETGAVCGDCRQGERACPACPGPKPAPALGDICAVAPCAPCEGRGLLPKTVRLPCDACRGAGVKLTPKVNPEKRLP